MVIKVIVSLPLVFGITVYICTVRYSKKKTNCIRFLLDNIHTLLGFDNAARWVYLNGIHMYNSSLSHLPDLQF